MGYLPGKVDLFFSSVVSQDGISGRSHQGFSIGHKLSIPLREINEASNCIEEFEDTSELSRQQWRHRHEFDGWGL